MKAGEGNPQAREEEGKLGLLGLERSSSPAGIPRMGIGIPWESHCFHLLEAVEGADEVADVVWMLLALKTFSMRKVDVLIQERRC